MKTINTDFVKQKWKYKPEFNTADMTSLSDLYIAAEINRRANELHRKKPTWVCQVLPEMKKVIFNGPATTILWKDGTKTTVKCQAEDVWSDEVGIAMCCLKRILGNEGNFNNIFRKAMKVAEAQYKKEELEK